MKANILNFIEYFKMPNRLKDREPEKHEALNEFMQDEENQMVYSYGLVDFEKKEGRVIQLREGKYINSVPLCKLEDFDFESIIIANNEFTISGTKFGKTGKETEIASATINGQKISFVLMENGEVYLIADDWNENSEIVLL